MNETPSQKGSANVTASDYKAILLNKDDGSPASGAPSTANVDGHLATIVRHGGGLHQIPSRWFVPGAEAELTAFFTAQTASGEVAQFTNAEGRIDVLLPNGDSGMAWRRRKNESLS